MFLKNTKNSFNIQKKIYKKSYIYIKNFNKNYHIKKDLYNINIYINEIECFEHYFKFEEFA